ncbi:MAG: NAD-dependent epimerase/dehydratase family protein, partial [Pseudomonadota bacterium]
MANALIIGASGGIGAALADHLAATHDVVRLSRSKDGLDVTDDTSVAEALADLPQIDLAFVATGILAPDGQAP